MANPVGEVLGGFALLATGLRLLVRRPKVFLLGAIPPAITSVIFLAALITLFSQLDVTVDWLTPFARPWSRGAAEAIHIAVGVALVAGVVLLMVVTFTTLTLALGSPLYDKISESVEREYGELPVHDEPVLTGVGRAVRQSLALIGMSLAGAPAFFLAGFIPVVGQTVVPVLAAIFGGWLLCFELIGAPFERRGLLTLADRRAAMRRRRLRVVGFAAPTFALLAVPLLAIVVFPVATAGGTVLARQLLGRDRAQGAEPRSVE